MTSLRLKYGTREVLWRIIGNNFGNERGKKNEDSQQKLKNNNHGMADQRIVAKKPWKQSGAKVLGSLSET